jgi:hypothetical protein
MQTLFLRSLWEILLVEMKAMKMEKMGQVMPLNTKVNKQL